MTLMSIQGSLRPSRVVFILDSVRMYQDTASSKMSLILSARRPLTNFCWSGSYYFAPRTNCRKLVDRILPLVVSNNPVDQFSAIRPGCKTRLCSHSWPNFLSKIWRLCILFAVTPATPVPQAGIVSPASKDENRR
jgi:hypothetical protein